MKYTTVLFDMDGTILDTLDDLTDCVNYTMNVMGWPLKEKMQIRSYLGNGIRRLMELSVPDGVGEADFEKAFAMLTFDNAKAMLKAANDYLAK